MGLFLADSTFSLSPDFLQYSTAMLPGGEHPPRPPSRGAAAPAEVLPADGLAGGEAAAQGLPGEAGLQGQDQALAGVRGEHCGDKHQH